MLKFFRSLGWISACLLVMGCGDGTGDNKALDLGGPEASAIATLVEDLNDAVTSNKKLDALFVKGSTPTDLKKLAKLSFYISGKPSVNGTNATCKVRIDDAAGKTLGEPEWSFEKVGDKWKIKTAPLA